jgi:Domain of unknown function (DUF4604)
MTFNAKNLHYEKQEPAFLRQLKAENTSDRHNVSISRPRKARLETGDDDGPTIVDEQGRSLTESEYQELIKGTTESGSVSTDVPVAGDPVSEAVSEIQGLLPDKPNDRVKDSVGRTTGVDNSGRKKRKQIKAVGTEPEPETETDLSVAHHASTIPQVDEANAIRTRSKRKKIKLSFDEPET